MASSAGKAVKSEENAPLGPGAGILAGGGSRIARGSLEPRGGQAAATTMSPLTFDSIRSNSVFLENQLIKAPGELRFECFLRSGKIPSVPECFSSCLPLLTCVPNPTLPQLPSECPDDFRSKRAHSCEADPPPSPSGAPQSRRNQCPQPSLPECPGAHPPP